MRLSSSFKSSFPVTLTSFINKSGSIGLTIIPVLLVERGLNADESSLVMAFVRGAGLTGVVLGGVLGDKLGLRPTLLMSFLVCGLGLAALPFAHGVELICLAGVVAQLGTSFYPAVARLLITQLVKLTERREAIAWQRTANNSAQILSYSFGAALGRYGSAPLFFIDAATSLLAAAVGFRLLPNPKIKSGADVKKVNAKATLRDFYLCALIIASYSCLYELYLVSAAAQCKILFGVDGLQVFSVLMIINTILCALFAVVATNWLNRATRVLPLGLFICGLGAVFTTGFGQSPMHFYFGSLIVTVGEIVFTSMAGFVLINVTPAGGREATIYGSGMLIQQVGRLVGATLAFPFVVYSKNPFWTPAIIFAVGLGLTIYGRKVLQLADES